jgi:spore coat polysaccharide biosynthesis protein SpsF
MILAILQVRMVTPRLPGKALERLRGEPMILRQLERIRLARTVDKVVVATSAEAGDDPLAATLVSRGQTVFRGSAENLAERFMRCVDAAGPVSHVVRLKGDSPFVDPGVIDQAVRLAVNSRCDYVSNRVIRSFPRGLEVEVVTVEALAAAAAEMSDRAAAQSSPLGWVRRQPDRFPQAHLTASRDWSALDWRVKTPADLAFARGVYDALYPADPAFGMEDVLDVLQGRQDLALYTA